MTGAPNRQVYGRVLYPLKPDGEPARAGGGVELIRQLHEAARARGIDIRTSHRVQRLVTDGSGRVVGVEATTSDGSTARIGAARGVVFASGGFVRAFDTATATLLWASPSIPGADGLATGLGTLTGYIYANCTTGKVWELGVPGGPHDGELNLLATGGSRGDFIAVDPNVYSGGSFPSLLLTQTDRVLRMDSPGGGFFGPPTSAAILTLG